MVCVVVHAYCLLAIVHRVLVVSPIGTCTRKVGTRRRKCEGGRAHVEHPPDLEFLHLCLDGLSGLAEAAVYHRDAVT